MTIQQIAAMWRADVAGRTGQKKMAMDQAWFPVARRCSRLRRILRGVQFRFPPFCGENGARGRDFRRAPFDERINPSAQAGI